MKKWLKDCGAIPIEAGILISFLAVGFIATTPQIRHGVNKAICSMLGGISGVQFMGTGQLSKFTPNPNGSSLHMCQTVVKTPQGVTVWGTVLNVNRFMW